MGNDYDARKRNKKLNKRAAEDSEAKQGDKRQRTKGRSKVRRLCRGACFSAPGISAEDKEWRGSDDEAADAWTQPDEDLFAPEANGRTDMAAKAAKPMRFSTQADPSAIVSKSAAAQDALASKKSHQSGDWQQETAERQQEAGAAVPAAYAALPPRLGRYMASQGFQSPTRIQTKVWAAALAGRDVVAVAQPGAGKTLAYLLAIAARLLGAPPVGAAASIAGSSASAASVTAAAAPSRPAPSGLVVVPTRELAQQVAGVARGLRPATGLKTALVHGGTDRAPQIAALEKGPQLLVATPGRLLDLVDAGALTLDGVAAVALDEADKILSLGFEPQLARLRGMLIPPTKLTQRQWSQVLLCTATMPDALRQTAAGWVKKPVTCRVKGDASGPADTPISITVTQAVHVCAEHKKPRKLLKHLDKVRSAAKAARNPPRALVFANRVKTVQFVAKTLSEAGHRVAILHGKRSQPEREAAMNDFRSGKATVLVATDVASRGLHVAALPVVVNYDLPPSLDTYIHRVGRTGRLASDGHALSFMTRNLAPLAKPLLELLQAHGQAVDPNLARLAAAYEEAVARLGGDVPQPDANGVASSDDDETEAAAGAPNAAEDLFEGLDAILSAPAQPSTAAEEAGNAAGESLSAAARKLPQLSSQAAYSEHEHKLPEEARAKGAAVRKNVSRRPIGAASTGAGNRKQQKARTAAADALAAEGGVRKQQRGSRQQKKQRLADSSILEAAAVGADAASLPGNNGTAATDAAADTSRASAGDVASDHVAAGAPDGSRNELFGGKPGKKRYHAIGGRLRKKLAKQRAAVTLAAE